MGEKTGAAQAEEDPINIPDRYPDFVGGVNIDCWERLLSMPQQFPQGGYFKLWLEKTGIGVGDKPDTYEGVCIEGDGRKSRWRGEVYPEQGERPEYVRFVKRHDAAAIADGGAAGEIILEGLQKRTSSPIKKQQTLDLIVGIVTREKPRPLGTPVTFIMRRCR